MKSLSTDLKTQAFKRKLKASNSYSYTKITYIDDDENEVDITREASFPIDISASGRAPKYSNVNYEPAASTVSFSVFNTKGKYSPKNILSEFNAVMVRDRIFKFYDGKFLNDYPEEVTDIFDLTKLDVFNHYTKLDGSGNIILDEDNDSGTTNDHFQDFTFGPSGSVRGYSVINIDRVFNKKETFKSFDIEIQVPTFSEVAIYYRFGNRKDEMEINTTQSTDWINYGSESSGGTINIDVGNITDSAFIQIGLILNSADYTSIVSVNSVSLNYDDYVEWISMGSFYIDDPDFEDAQSPDLSMVKIKGRNAWKRAIDTKINIDNLSSGVYINNLLKNIADKIGLTYTASSIADLSSYGQRLLSTGYEEQVQASEIIKDILQIIGRDYRLRVDDEGILYTQARPRGYSFVYVFDYKNYIKAQLKDVSEKRIQRITCQTDQQPLSANVELDSDTFSSVSSGILSWTGGAVAKYFEADTTSGDIQIIDVEYGQTQATFTFSGTGDIDVTIYGCKYQSSEPTYYGEAANSDNILNKNGFTFRELNLLLISDEEAKTISENFVDEFGTVEYNIKVKEPYLSSLYEINDQVLTLSANYFETQLYEVIGIKHQIGSHVDKTTTYELIDTGRNLLDQGDLIYDRVTLGGDSVNLNYDTGLIYDATFPVGVTREEILAVRDYYTDVDFE